MGLAQNAVLQSLFLVIGAAACASPADDLASADSELNGAWRHVTLGSDDGTRIALDYQNTNAGTAGSGGQIGGDVASPLWINMTHDSFTGFEPVVVTFHRYCHTIGDSRPWAACGEESVRLGWAPSEQKFTAQAPPLSLLSNGTCAAYEVSFFIGTNGGRQLVDPINGTSRFVLNLADRNIAKRCEQ